MKDEPQLQSRGLWIPIDIFHLLETGVLNPTEVLLAALIDGYVHLKGEGCWATNKMLAKRLNRTPTGVADSISKLVKLKLVRQTGWKTTDRGRFRLLETTWSRVGGLRKFPKGGSSEKSEDGSSEISEPIDIVQKKRDTKVSRRPVGANGTSHNGNGFSKDFPTEKKSTNRPSSIHYQYAEEFHRKAEKLTKKRIKWSKHAWAGIFAYEERNSEDGYERVKKFLDAYLAGSTPFTFTHPNQFVAMLPHWERKKNEIEWVRVDGWKQKFPPNARQIAEESWKPYRNGQELPKEERLEFRRKILNGAS